jgi:hypothetical protein
MGNTATTLAPTAACQSGHGCADDSTVLTDTDDRTALTDMAHVNDIKSTEVNNDEDTQETTVPEEDEEEEEILAAVENLAGVENPAAVENPAGVDHQAVEEKSRDPPAQVPSDDYVQVEANTKENDSSNEKKADKSLMKKLIPLVAQEQQQEPAQDHSLQPLSIEDDLTLEDLKIPSEEDGGEEEIDMQFVKEYETCFNEFIVENPHFMMKNPDLLHNLRVSKLQKSLELAYGNESKLIYNIRAVQAKKLQMTDFYHEQLREAARKKAAREIHLQQELDTIEQATRVMEGRLTWQMVAKCEARAKKHLQLQQLLEGQQADRKDLLSLLPDLPETHAVRDAATAPNTMNSGGVLSEQQAKDLQQFQVDNAFLSAEVTVLEKKLAYLQVTAKKYAWVDSVFLHMDAKKVKRLKSRYQKKLGVTF